MWYAYTIAHHYKNVTDNMSMVVQETETHLQCTSGIDKYHMLLICPNWK